MRKPASHRSSLPLGQGTLVILAVVMSTSLLDLLGVSAYAGYPRYLEVPPYWSGYPVVDLTSEVHIFVHSLRECDKVLEDVRYVHCPIYTSEHHRPK